MSDPRNEQLYAAIRAGNVLGEKYRVDRTLGVGGFGIVLAATHVHLEERIAIKLLLPQAAGSPEAVARFLREAKAAVKIRSEHVARVTDVGTLPMTGMPEGMPYMVMEYLEGQDLSALVKTSGGQAVPNVVEWVLQSLEALAEAHSLGIVHRDLKPANLFLTMRPDGTPNIKVLDFGISKITAADSTDKGMTKTSDVMGSPYYMSPEQMKSTRDVDARTDIWAMGTILFELLGGAPPFDGETMPALLAAILQEPPRNLGELRPDVPPQLWAIIQRCLEKKPEARFANVAELAQALAPFAPLRARVSVDRILGLVGSAPSLPGAISGPLQPAVAAASASWGATVGSATKPKSNAPLVLVGVGFVAIGVAIAAVLFGPGLGPSDPPASAGETTGETSESGDGSTEPTEPAGDDDDATPPVAVAPGPETSASAGRDGEGTERSPTVTPDGSAAVAATPPAPPPAGATTKPATTSTSTWRPPRPTAPPPAGAAPTGTPPKHNDPFGSQD